MERSLRLSDAKHVEKEKDALEAGKQEAEAYLIAENEITLKQNELYQAYGHQCAQNMSEASEKHEAELAKKSAAQETLAAKEADIKTAESECVIARPEPHPTPTLRRTLPHSFHPDVSLANGGAC
jgi:structural maintenance of chromosome 4